MGTFVQRSNIVHVLMVLDMSGSMSDKWDDTIGGANSYIEGLKADGGADYRVTIVNFDTEYEVLCAAVPLSEVPKLDKSNYCPRGMTALYDAVGRAITEAEPRVMSNEKAIVVVVTDGQENASREYTQYTIKPKIEALQALGNWTFVYLGATASAWGDASAMGISSSNTLRYSKRKTKGMYEGLTKATLSYSADYVNAQSMNFMQDYGRDLVDEAAEDEDGQ